MPSKNYEKYLTWRDDEGELVPFKWDSKRHKAASLIAEGYSNKKTAEALKCEERLVAWWRKHPDFGHRVKKIIDEAGIEAATIAIANRVNRMRGYDDLLNRHFQVIEERAANPSGDAHPGMSSGLVVRREKQIPLRSGGVITDLEYQVDNATSAEIRALYKQAAQESGQWSEKTELEVSGGVERSYVVEDVAGGIIAAFDIEAELAFLNEESSEPGT